MTAFQEVEPLGFRRALETREPALGFASRLAALNGVDLSTLLRDMRVAHHGLDHGREDAVLSVAALGGLGKRDTAALLANTPRRVADDRTSVVRGHRLAAGAVLRTYFRFCPLCVSEDVDAFDGPARARPWLRLEWTLKDVRSCRRHDVDLVSTSPIRRPFQAFDFSETVAAQVLPGLAALRRGAARVPHSAFEDWVVARIDGTVRSDAWLDGFSLRAGIAFCEALGVSAGHAPKVKTAEFDDATWSRAAAAGFAVASGGPDAVRRLLDGLYEAQAGTRGVIGLRDTYGYVYGMLRRGGDDPDFAGFRDVVRDHAFGTLPLEAGTEVLGAKLDVRRVHTVRSASMASGAHARTIRRMFERKGIDAAGRGSGVRDHRVTVGAAGVATALAKLKDAMTMPEVMEATGIPRLHLRSMVAQGYLPTLTDSRNVAHAKHRFARDEVSGLMERLFAGSRRVAGPSGRRMSVMDARHAACATLDAAIAFVFGGPKWKGRVGSGKHYGNLLVDAAELTDLVRVEAPMVGLLKHRVDEVIPGLGKDSVDLLAGMGHLVAGMEFSPDARREVQVVTRESALAFAGKYVALGELCRTTGLHHKRVRQALREGGVEEAFPYDLAGAFFYARTPAVQALSTP